MLIILLFSEQHPTSFRTQHVVTHLRIENGRCEYWGMQATTDAASDTHCTVIYCSLSRVSSTKTSQQHSETVYPILAQKDAVALKSPSPQLPSCFALDFLSACFFFFIRCQILPVISVKHPVMNQRTTVRLPRLGNAFICLFRSDINLL